MSFFREIIQRLEAKSFLGEVIKDYGIISEDKLGGAFKKTSILLCRRQGKLQIVMRTSSFAYLAAGVKYEYLPASCASRLKAIVEDVEVRDAKMQQPDALQSRGSEVGQQITYILKQTFQGMDVDLDEAPSGRLHGAVIWDGFDEQEMGDRQDLVRKVLKEALGAQFQEIGILLTYTPRQMAPMRAA